MKRKKKGGKRREGPRNILSGVAHPKPLLGPLLPHSWWIFFTPSSSHLLVSFIALFLYTTTATTHHSPTSHRSPFPLSPHQPSNLTASTPPFGTLAMLTTSPSPLAIAPSAFGMMCSERWGKTRIGRGRARDRFWRWARLEN